MNLTGSAPDYDPVAPYYDQMTASLPDTQDAIDCLAGLVPEGGRVLELGVGTGRIACPLAQRGFSVTGVDNSSGMLTKLRSRPDGTYVEIRLASFVDVQLNRQFDLIYIAFNSLFCVTTQEEQLRTIQNATAHLAPGGKLVVETDVPDLARSNVFGTGFGTGSVERDRIFLEASDHDSATQRIRTQTIIMSAEGIMLFPLLIRYIWPSELDLMASLSGLVRVNRMSNWTGSPFTRHSTKHIGVFERASA